MTLSTATDDGFPIKCEICGNSSIVNISQPTGDSVCSSCGCFLWVAALVEVTRQHEFVPDLQLSKIQATNRDDAIRELTSAIARELNWNLNQEEGFVRAVVQREDLGTTGMGRGIAVPHGKMDWIEKSFTAMALAPNGISFDSLDGKLVHTIIMIASPTSRPREHLEILARISRALIWRGRNKE